MKTSLLLVALACIVLHVLVTHYTCAQVQVGDGLAPAIDRKHSSLGATKHITVYGDNARRNKAVSSVCDDMVRKLAKFLGEPEPKKSVYPIHLRLYSKGNAKKGVKYTTSVFPVEGKGYSVELIVDIRERIDKSILEHGIMQALVLERTLRTNPEINKQTRVEVPVWLSDGLVGAVHWKEAPSNKSVYNLLKLRPELYPLKELLKTDEDKLKQLGATKLDIYRASATALVLSLQRQKQGKESLAKMLGEVAVFEGEPEELFRRHFPTMNVGSRGLQKLWNLQLADMSASRLLDTLTIIQTEERLDKLLFFTLRGKGGVAKIVPIEEYNVLAGLADQERIQVIYALRQKIQQLSYRCYPDYQPLLAEYSFILTDITMGKFETINLRLSNLTEERARKLEAGIRVRNVLDWYQISQAKGLVGDFSGYAKVIEQIELERKQNADPVIAPYVDKIDDLMER